MALDRYGKGKAWLEKMGWKEGQGLGKNNDGIKKYIGVVKKVDTAGVGVDKFQWDDMWWDNMYKKAAKNITPGSEVKVVPKQVDPLYHGTFTKNTSEESSDDEKGEVEGEELLQKCEGRLLRRYVPEGKLKRIQHQDTKFTNGEDLIPPTPKPAEKLSSKSEKCDTEKSDVSEDSDNSEALSSENEEEKREGDKKKSKKEKKRESEAKKRKRDSEDASSSESAEDEEENEKKAKKKERREKKERKEKKRHAKDKTDKDKKKKKNRKDKDSKEKKKHKKIKS